MNVLVTGATGFAGSSLAIRLAKQGSRVHALCRPGSNIDPLVAQGVEISEGDITDPDAVDRAVRGMEKVYHIAACFRTAGHPDEYYRAVNRDGTAHVLEAARRHGCERVVHCSTGGVHGHIEPEIAPADENTRFNPGDIYQVTKLEGELLAQKAITTGQPVSIFRPAAIYGPGDLRLLKMFRMIQKRRFVMFGRGEVHYGLVYIDDLVDGILLCGERDEALGETFILSGPESLPLKVMVATIAAALHVSAPRLRFPVGPLLAAAAVCERVCVPLRIDPPLHRRRAHLFINNREFTHAKAANMLGYMPKVHAEEGLHRTAEWYVREGLLEGPPPEAMASRHEAPETLPSTRSDP
jgi:dihydroflavonol-4-reductase